MKRRVPDSFEHALTIIIAALGADECGRIIGKSASLIHKASDPDHEFKLNLNQALALDMEYQKRTGEAPPINQVYQRQLEITKVDPANLFTGVLSLIEKVGDCSAKVREYSAPDSDGGSALSNNERGELIETIDRVENTAANMKRSLKIISPGN